MKAALLKKVMLCLCLGLTGEAVGAASPVSHQIR